MLHHTATAADAPNLLDELEDEIALSHNAHVSLDDLMAESLKDRKASEDVKAARQLLAKGHMSTAERESITASVRSWEMKREWLPQASVVMFARQQCQGCGDFHKQFLGFFQRQQHRHTKIDRWIASTKPVDNALPRESKYQDSHCELCENCAEALGYDVEEN